ncbi:xanthine dehydrogenase family protein molybdopterin-binding subunit [Natrarchaeobius halalkaliphilus]|uniref:Xanthine dehydrogenase family protein molybdopterin-binding subunit n=1 Tax=Natrarchaeobius halalkaliphilus TaxID=1679091 RepID=A0A3N6MBW0_9EURY|nr:molybdopterin cofactor-binding domain-containing protein [Natrarchaeobius halalkaliphilus]RQG92961.1 xanthine dehydrogenase family protein molybdopterin-binding subunit [Natrarchaeobius halalkaliphilus]
MSENTALSRRRFLQGSALVVAFSLTSPSTTAVASAQEELPGSLEDTPELNAWIAIEDDATVTVYTGKVELGQGIKTALAQIAADELEVEFGRIDLVTAATETTPDEGYTAGSQSMEDSGTAITYAAAQARRILLESAAEELGGEPGELSVEDGTITDGGGNEITYWDVVEDESFATDVSADVETKPPDEKAIVGSERARVDIPGKIFGDPSYVQDLRRPSDARGGADIQGEDEGEDREDVGSEELLHGRVVRPPGYVAELESVDEEEVAEMDGVIEIVRDGDFLGVVAQTEWQAIQAMEELRDGAEWNVEDSLPGRDDLYDHLREDTQDDTVVEEDGDTEAALSDAAETLEAEYRRPYQMHASIGPSCAVAEIVADDQERVLNVWTHSQGVYPLQEALEELVEAKQIDEVNCTHLEGSGCYGHNGADDVAGDAAMLTYAVEGQPVRVQWMREDENQWEPLGSAMLMEPRAGLSDDGTIVGWEYDVWSYPHSTRPPGQPLLAGMYREDAIETRENSPIPLPTGGGTRNSIPLYELENTQITHHFLPEPDVRVSALRALGGYANVFALESFVDELAHAAETDPVEFRLEHMADERARDVIETAAEEAGWADPDLNDDQGIGIGFAQYKNLSAYAAVVVEVTVDSDSGEVTVDRAVAADDSGEIVNPIGVRQQIRGGIIQSASWTLLEDVDFDAQGVTDTDWGSYPILTFPDVPDVHVELIDRPGEPYLGTGEASQGPTAAAIGNAVYDAVGARVREIPITPDRIQDALD